MANLPATKCPTCNSEMDSEDITDRKERVVARNFKCCECDSRWKLNLNTRHMRRA